MTLATAWVMKDEKISKQTLLSTDNPPSTLRGRLLGMPPMNF